MTAEVVATAEAVAEVETEEDKKLLAVSKQKTQLFFLPEAANSKRA
jgi:hypothetical protein